MFTLQDLLNAGLPAVSTDGNINTQFSRTLTPTEWVTYLSIADPDRAKRIQAAIDLVDTSNLLATLTQAQFQTWCDNNLMTDAQVDATTLSPALKTNIKALNLFARKAGTLVLACRDALKFILKFLA